MDARDKARLLAQYRHLRREAELLERKLRELERRERGSDAPRDDEAAARRRALAARLRDWRRGCLARQCRIYAFIEAIDDSLVRQIMICRYIDGDTWQRVALRIGERDEQYPRRLHNRYLQRTPLPEFWKGKSGSEKGGEGA